MANEKSRPQIEPAAPKPGLRSLKLREPGAEKNLRVSLRINGGLPSQKFRLDFQAAGDGTVSCEVDCQLSGRHGKTEEKVRLEAQELRGLLETIVESGVLDLPEEQPAFLPDTVVGILEISDGSSTRRFYFAADPDQAEVQGKVPPPELQRTLEAIYGLGAKLTGLRSVKP